MTVKDAIGDLKKFKPVWNEDFHKKRISYTDIENDINWHKPRYHNIRDMKIYEMLAKDIEKEEFKYLDPKKITEIYEERVGSKSPIHRYHVLRKDQPSTTITAHLHKDGLRFIHYDSAQKRTITVREAARLQSFPDDFKFLSTRGNQYKMIGNAVPPEFARRLSIAVKEFMDFIKNKRS